ncbi:VanZ family protein [Streptomyces sp. NPDC059740]|uniref:VanZ family protein n=1 Tax=Streptomyces sp. NPDC059740 TaxID=3346926 RepID=UPI00365094DD
MFEAAFRGQSWFIFVTVVVALLLGVAAYSLAKQRGWRRFEWALFTVLFTSIVAVTLAMPGGGIQRSECVLNRNIFEPLMTSEGLLNLAMYVPLGLAGFAATRAVVPTLVTCACLSLVTEVSQALLPWVGRNCDSGDFFMNSAGGALGIALGCLYLRLIHARVEPRRLWKPALGVGAVIFAVAGGTAAFGLTLTVVDATSVREGDSEERSAAEHAIQQAFDGHYTVSRVQFSPSLAGSGKGFLDFTLNGGAGSAELTWPDKRTLTVSLENSDKLTAMSFPVTGNRTPPHNAQDAQRIAQIYADQHYPKSTHGSKVTVAKVDAAGRLGWMVSWRRVNPEGVLMPMRLDVEVNRAGRVSQLLTTPTADPGSLPPVKISEQKARSAGQKSIDALLTNSKVKVSGTRLEAANRGGKWRTEYVVTYVTLEGKPSEAVSYVDATTGHATSQ